MRVWVGGIVGVLLVVVGAVWLGQGMGAIGGSFMTGRTSYAVLGAVVVVAGVAVLAWTYRGVRGRRRPTD